MRIRHLRESVTCQVFRHYEKLIARRHNVRIINNTADPSCALELRAEKCSHTFVPFSTEFVCVCVSSYFAGREMHEKWKRSRPLRAIRACVTSIYIQGYRGSLLSNFLQKLTGCASGLRVSLDEACDVSGMALTVT